MPGIRSLHRTRRPKNVWNVLLERMLYIRIHLNSQVNINFYDSSLWHYSYANTRKNTFSVSVRFPCWHPRTRALYTETRMDEETAEFCEDNAVVQEILEDSDVLVENER